MQLVEAQNALSLALGVVLGSMCQRDEEAYRRDAESPVPRMFMLGPKASLDRIKGQVYVTEQVFNQGAKLRLRPEHVIVYSENMIEGLTKDLWGAFVGGLRQS